MVWFEALTRKGEVWPKAALERPSFVQEACLHDFFIDILTRGTKDGYL